MTIEKMARIFLIDDHPVVRQGLTQLLSQESYFICGESSSIRNAVEKIELSHADLVILDLSLGEESGLELIADLKKSNIRILIYSMHEDADTIEESFNSGASGYVSKREQEDVLISAVSELLVGRRYLSPLVANVLANNTLFMPMDGAQYKLSKREKNILSKLGQGESNSEIANSLFISVRTVETYYSRIIEKLGLKNMKELRKYAIKNLRNTS